MGPDLPFDALCGECHPHDPCRHVWPLPGLQPLCHEGDARLYAFRGTRAHGLDQLYLSVVYGHGAVLWSRYGMGHIGGAGHDRVHRHGCFHAVGVAEQAVAPFFPVRTFGMDLALADLRPLFQDLKVRFTVVSVSTN